MFATLELPLRDDGRNKRLQGGRACQPCRMKKIKCDGKQPCMQCKGRPTLIKWIEQNDSHTMDAARHRTCNFLKISDESYIRLDLPDAQRGGNDNVTHPNDSMFVLPQTTTPPPSDAVQAPSRTDRMIEQLADGLVRLSLQQDGSPKVNPSVTPWVDYGDFVRWSPEPSPPRTYSVAIEMPSRQTQEHLIEMFFEHCVLLPTFSRHMFHDQIQAQGTLITPLLLNVMYAHAAKHEGSHQSNSAVYFARARRLLDDFMDVSRISTVIALLYMALYNDGSRSSLSWMYSGMAVRMCLDLGLHTSNYSSQMSQFDIEIRRRVLWSCYTVDKLESSMLERPYAIPLNDVSLDLPTALPEDSDNERHILRGFTSLCRLLMLMEKIVQFFCRSGKPRHSEWTLDDEKRTTQFLEDIRQWQGMLPEDMRMSSSQPTTPVVTNLHLLYYVLELSLLLCLRYQNVRAQQRLRVRTIIQLVSITAQDCRALYSSTLTAFSGLLAALTLVNDIQSIDSKVADEASLLFRQCLEDVRTVLPTSPLRDMHEFTRLLDMIPQPKPSPLPVNDLALANAAVPYGQPSFSSAMTDLGCDADGSHFLHSHSPRRRYPTAPVEQYTFDPPGLHTAPSTILPIPTSSSSSTAATTSATSTSTSTSSKHIEPADYTFELISIADEWARALNNFPSNNNSS